MKPAQRSLAGAALAILAIPAFLGLMACLPVPVGDPEKSRIDPEITGVWFMEGNGAIVVLDPFDKRSWLMTIVGIDRDDDYCPYEPGLVSGVLDYEDFVGLVETEGSECLITDGEIDLYKVWVTELAGQKFLIWEPKLFWTADVGFDPAIWFAFRVNRLSADHLSLVWVDAEYFEEVEGFQELLDNFEEDIVSDPSDIKRVSKKVTRMIRRNVDDPELYYEDDENDLVRISEEHLIDALELVDEIIGAE